MPRIRSRLVGGLALRGADQRAAENGRGKQQERAAHARSVGLTGIDARAGMNSPSVTVWTGARDLGSGPDALGPFRDEAPGSFA